MGLQGYFQGKGEGVHIPVTKRWAAWSRPRRERSTGERMMPTRGPDAEGVSS